MESSSACVFKKKTFCVKAAREQRTEREQSSEGAIGEWERISVSVSLYLILVFMEVPRD